MIAHSRRRSPRNADSARAAIKGGRLNQAATHSADEWWVQVRESAYGPYTYAQVRQFIQEGRIKAHSLIARERNGAWREARLVDEFYDALKPARSGGEPTATPQGDAAIANVFVFAEIHSGAWNAFMAALEQLGMLAELAPGFWLLRTMHSSGVVRNTLSQTLETGDRFVVVDATRDRLAWFNMGPGVDVSIREVWNAAL